MQVDVLQVPSFNMNWVDDDPCECCGSGEHYLEDCSVLYEKVQANKEREDYLSGLFEYRRADYEDCYFLISLLGWKINRSDPTIGII